MFESVFGVQKNPGEEWAFDGQQWKAMPDPLAQWSETEEQWYEAVNREGYMEWFTTGDRGNNFWFITFAPNPARVTPLQQHFPFLVSVEVSSTIYMVYCASFPAVLALIEKLNALHTVWRAGKDRYGRSQTTDQT